MNREAKRRRRCIPHPSLRQRQHRHDQHPQHRFGAPSSRDVGDDGIEKPYCCDVVGRGGLGAPSFADEGVEEDANDEVGKGEQDFAERRVEEDVGRGEDGEEWGVSVSVAGVRVAQTVVEEGGRERARREGATVGGGEDEAPRCVREDGIVDVGVFDAACCVLMEAPGNEPDSNEASGCQRDREPHRAATSGGKLGSGQVQEWCSRWC
jgi:hypothetical protein